MSKITAADFIAYLDEAVNTGKITDQDNNLLLKDMSIILDIVLSDSLDYEAKYEKMKLIKYIENRVELQIYNYSRVYFNNKLLTEAWHDNNFEKLHRLGDKPARVIYRKSNGSISEERYIVHGAHYRDGGKPNVIGYFEDGKIFSEEWHENGKRNHTGDKPALIEYYRNGSIRSEEWYKNDKRHRTGDKPAEVGYDDNGSVILQGWWANSQRHRDHDKPAVIKYNNGRISEEIWWQHGNAHRDGGKSIYVGYNKDGTAI